MNHAVIANIELALSTTVTKSQCGLEYYKMVISDFRGYVLLSCLSVCPGLTGNHVFSACLPAFPHHITPLLFKVIEEIVEMMENSPDPGETEEEDEEEGSHCSSRDNPSLLEEIRQLSQASNNNCSYEGTANPLAYLG